MVSDIQAAVGAAVRGSRVTALREVLSRAVARGEVGVQLGSAASGSSPAGAEGRAVAGSCPQQYPPSAVRIWPRNPIPNVACAQLGARAKKESSGSARINLVVVYLVFVLLFLFLYECLCFAFCLLHSIWCFSEVSFFK